MPDQKPRSIQILSAFATALLALTLSGCIIIPMPGLFTMHHVKGKVGGPSSSAPLKVSVSSKEDVLRVLGKPDADMSVQNDWIYANDNVVTSWSFWLIPLPHSGFVEHGTVWNGVRIYFRADGKISGYNEWGY